MDLAYIEIEEDIALSAGLEPPLFAAPSSVKSSRGGTFLLSLVLHGMAVALLSTASRSGWLEVKPRLYREPVAVQEHRIIWYTRPADLPAVAPIEAPRRPIRERRERPPQYHPRDIVASHPKPESRRQMVLQSPPELRLELDLRAPNILAWNPPSPPPAPPKPKFEPPVPMQRVARPAPLPDVKGPELPATPSAGPVPIAMEPVRQPERPKFQVPQVVPRRPLERRALAADAPDVAVTLGVRTILSGLGPKGPGPAPIEPPPSEVAAAVAPSTVIVGLDPAPQALLPPPPGNREAQFATGSQADGKGEGATSPAEVARAEIHVPNLAIAPAAAAAAPTVTRPPPPPSDRAAFRKQLLSSLPGARTGLPGPPEPAGPDAVLRGSTVYTMAVDMPNITSYEGSWIVRFTELGGSSPEDVLTAPMPMRKVDPKYIAAAAAEGVEGKVLLYAVIRRDGRVDQVRLVRGIDERLDSSAVAALSKWEFQPATKNGQPVDLEAVVQIPFRVRPRK